MERFNRFLKGPLLLLHPFTEHVGFVFLETARVSSEFDTKRNWLSECGGSAWCVGRSKAI